MTTSNHDAGKAQSEPKVRASRADYPVFRQITTRWMDNDSYGHVNNVVYYSFFDTAVNADLIERGFLDVGRSQVFGLVAETGCRYVESLSFPDRIDAGLRVARLGKSSVRYEIGLFRDGAELAAAEGFFVHVYVDRDSRRPAPIPAELRAYFHSICGPSAS